MTDQLLCLKWGTVKGWDNLSDASFEAIQKWSAFGASVSAMTHRDTPEQKAALCEVIDTVASEGGEIWNDWTGKSMSADEAKKYVMEYGTC